MSEVNVHPEGEVTSDAAPAVAPEAPNFVTNPVPEIAASPFDGLRQKLQKVRDTLTTDFEVPRWPELMGLRVFVRCAPTEGGFISEQTEKWQRSKLQDWRTTVNAQVLVSACRGVYAIEPKATLPPEYEATPGDGIALSMREGDPDGPWTRFDQDLATRLGVTEQDAIVTCKALFFTPGDVDFMALALIDWSAKTPEEAAAGFQTP